MRLLIILIMIVLATPLVAQPVEKKKSRKSIRRDTVMQTNKVLRDSGQIRSFISIDPVESSEHTMLVQPKSRMTVEPLVAQPMPARPPVSNYIFQIDPLDDTSYRYWFGRRNGSEANRDYTQELLDRGFYHVEDIKGYDSTIIQVEEGRLIPLRAGSTPIVVQTGWFSTHQVDTLMLNIERSPEGWSISQAPVRR